jgi:methionine-rich copper-binding protein CopC
MVSSNSHGRKGVQIHFARNAVGITLLLLAHGAWSRPMQMTDSFPAAQAIVDGNNAQYVVRFDGPVDHRASHLVITQGDRVVRNLTPLLDAAPNVLFASGPRLPAGDYQLRWSAKSMPDGDSTDGSIPFSVGR